MIVRKIKFYRKEKFQLQIALIIHIYIYIKQFIDLVKECSHFINYLKFIFDSNYNILKNCVFLTCVCVCL